MVKLSEITEEQMNDYCIEILIQIDYNDREEAKKLGAKWNPDYKQWCFRYKYGKYQNDSSLHTFKYSPDMVSIVKWNDKIKGFLPISMTGTERVALLKEAMNRYLACTKASVKKGK